VSQELQVEIYKYIVSKVLSKKDLKEYGKVFKVLDKNGDGSLTPMEIRQGFDKHFNISISKKEIGSQNVIYRI
jgi:Ca2+-binding EF-hand superfamily protein